MDSKLARVGATFSNEMMTSNIAKRTWALVAVVAGCALLASCFETEQEFTLNPDGTGKMELNTVFPNVSLDGDTKRDDAALNEAVSGFLKEAEGIEAWKDVSYAWTDDGRIRFKGTGYFTDISEIDLQNIMFMGFSWETEGANGTLTMSFENDEDDKEAKEISSDPAERAKEIKAERAQFQQSKPMMAGVLTGMKHSAVFNLPGKAGETVNLATAPDGRVGIKITGEKLISSMESLVNDDEWMAKNSFDAQNGPDDTGAFMEKLFGNNAAPVARRVSMGEPLFDYAKELAAARTEFAKLQEKFGTRIGPAASGEPFESLEVVGVRSVSEVDNKLGLRPFHQEAGYSLSVLGKFPGSVLSVTDESKVEKAVADDGSDLLPSSDFKRKFNFPQLSEDRSAVLFEINLRSPGDSVKSIREISGTFQYTVAKGTKEVDLGFTSLKAGESGKELGAEISEIKDGWKKDGTKEMDIKLALGVGELEQLILVDGRKRTVMEKRGHSSFGNGPTTFTFEAGKGLPENGTIIAVIYDGIETFDVPFKLENLTLMGAPAGK